MTYLAVRRSSMGGIWEEFSKRLPSDEMACLNAANASPQVLSIDAMIDNLVRTWNPTGYFRPSEVRMVLDAMATLATKVGKVIADAPRSTATAVEIKDQAFEDILRKWKDQSLNYEAALSRAASSGSNVIDAPGLKSWVISSLRSMSDGYVAAAMLECQQGWFGAILDGAFNAMATAGAVVARALGVAKDLAVGAVKAVEKVAGITAKFIEYAPYLGLGLGAYVLYKMYKNR